MKFSISLILTTLILLLSLACDTKTKNNLDTIKIQVSKENFQTIKDKRRQALDIGVLLTSKADYISIQFMLDSQTVKSKMRLKGDWVDHLEHKNKWSFRVKVGEGMTYHGMRKFSLQHPSTRNYIYEWVFHKMQKDMGLISMRYEFVNLILEVDGKEKDLGVYVLEEAFDKRMIENNERRTGIILKFDETALWEDRVYAKQNDTAEHSFEEMYQNAPIVSFNKKKVRKDSTLQMQFQAGKNLLEKYRNKELASQYVFDLEKIAKFLALVDLLGGEHAVVWHNLRFYYNPITALLEPIGFDAIGGLKYDYVIENHIMGSDSSLIPFHDKALQTVVSDSFLIDFKKKYETEMNEILKNLNTEFDNIVFDEDILKHNQNTIKNYLKKRESRSKENLNANTEALKLLAQQKFIEIDRTTKTIEFKKGNWTLNQTINIPIGFKVLANSGFNLDLTNGAEIISESAFIFKGNKENPIKISSSKGNGDGLLLKNCKEKSLFEYVDFVNLSNPKNETWSITGAVTIYKSDVDLKNVQFISNRSEDALNIFDASFTMENGVFKKTFSDAFDGDFVNGSLKNCSFSKLGNDAIDISGSDIFVENIFITAASDKCISAGERSTLNGKNLTLTNSELAITSKDLSEINLSSLEIDSCKVGFTAFQKKSEFDRATINVTETKVMNTQLLHLIEENSSLTINGKLMPNTTNVKERLYGKEFGKKSK